MGFSNSTGIYTPATGSESAAPGQIITSATWNAINTDYANNMRPTGELTTTQIGINLNSTGDNQINVPLPTGYTNYIVKNLFASNASAVATTAKVGLYTVASQGGTAITASATTGTPITLSPSTSVTCQQFTINNQFTKTLSTNPLFFNVATAQGTAATCTVTIQYSPVS